jgi:hypothetical protein
VIIPHRDNIRTVAAIHQQDAGCRVVIASLRGGNGGGDVDIKLAETVNLAAGPAMFTSLIERAGNVDAVIRVLPAACTVVRVTGLPESAAEAGESSNASIADALALIAEAELPTAVPEFRRAAGMINPGRGVGRKAVGLLTAWPTTAEMLVPGSPRTPRVAPEVAISEAAALAILAQLVGGVERAWTVDRSAGAMTILAAGPEKTVARVVRIPAGDSGASARETALVETGRAAGLVAQNAHSATDGWLHLDPTPTSPRIAGQQRSAEWLSNYGLAAAAIIAFADPNRAVSGLVELHEVEPKAKPPILQRLTEWAGAPRWAAAIIAICVIVLIGLPIGVSYAKLRILERHVTDQSKLFTQNNEDERVLSFYKLLREKRWPMTKLLADIAGACPQGISIESVEIGQGDGITLRGTADDTNKLTTFRENLGKTRIFTDPTTPSVNPTGSSGVQFQLTAKVPPNAATSAAKPAEDWAAQSLSERMYGEKAATPKRSSTTRTDRTDRTSTRGDRRTTPASRPSTSSSRDNGRDTSARGDRSATNSSTSQPKQPLVIPPELSDAAIAKLSRDDAMKEWTNRKRVAAQPGVDETVKRRLLDESEKAKTRMLEAGQGGGK